MNTALFQAQNQTNLQATADVLGRIGLAAIFLLAGFGKISAYEGTAGYMASMGLPGGLLPLVIVFEIGAGLALAAGFLTRLTSLALAGFSVVTAFIFHFNLADQMQFILFWKNIAMAGGFLIVAVHGASQFSVDAKVFGQSA